MAYRDIVRDEILSTFDNYATEHFHGNVTEDMLKEWLKMAKKKTYGEIPP